jgi:hypothetical protein
VAPVRVSNPGIEQIRRVRITMDLRHAVIADECRLACLHGGLVKRAAVSNQGEKMVV